MSHAKPRASVRAGSRACGVPEFDAPDSAWNVAAAAPAQGDPFCCRTEWQLSFHDTFAPGRALHLRHDRGSVAAFAERNDARLGTLLEPVECSWLFGCPLLGSDAVDLLDALLQEWAAAVLPNVLISGILPASTLRRQLLATFHGRRAIYQLEPNIQVSASLAGGLDGFLSRRTAHLRRNLGQQARRAAEKGVHYERHAPRSAAEADAVYARMLAVEQRSWKGIGRCGMAESPSREFYQVMLRRLAVSGGGRVVFARCGDDDIGFIFGGMAGGVYRGQQFSYIEAWSKFGIGNLLQIEQVRWLCEEGAQRYDMGPKMDYKRHWTEVETRMDAWLLRAL